MNDHLPQAKKYTPAPYWGCPNCGGNCWGATNPTARHEEYVFRCHGTQVGMVTYPGCGKLFTMPPEAVEEHRQELIDEGFEVV